jgi:putative transposase
VTTGSFGVLDDRHVRLPRIGAVRAKEPTTKLAWRAEAGAARVGSATVSEIAGRWYVSFTCQVVRAGAPAPPGGRPSGWTWV